MSSTALSLESTTIQMAEEIKVRASIEVSFAALLDQLAPPVVWSGARGVSKRKEWLGALARADAAAS